MGLSAAEYGRLLLTTLPPGKAFTREPGSYFAALCEAFGSQVALIDGRIEVLQREADPGKAVELLAEWETLLGLPDDCAPLGTTIQQRQAAALAKLGAIGDPRPAGLVALALALGVTVTLQEFTGTDCTNGTCVEPVYGTDWAHAFSLTLPLGTVVDATCESACDSALSYWANDALECAIAQAKPAHAAALFLYV